MCEGADQLAAMVEGHVAHPLRTHEKVVIQRNSQGYRSRKLSSLYPIGGGRRYAVHNADVDTTLRGLLERVYYRALPFDKNALIRQPLPDPDFVKKSMGPYRNRLLKFTNHVNQYSVDKFLGCYVARKLRTYTKAAKSLETRPLERKDAYIGAFDKAEKTDVTTKEDPCPRIIQPRSPRYNLRVGCYIKPMEKMLCEAINKMWGDVTVMKGLNADQVGAAFAKTADRFIKPVWISLDASRLDQSISVPLLQIEHSIYNAVIQSAELRALLKMQLCNYGFIRCENGSVKYVVSGGRASGDMNTSLGNVLIVCLLMLMYIESVDLTVDDVALRNNGDDCVFVTEEENLSKFDGLQEWFLQYGQFWKVEQAVRVLEEVDFCQSHPVRVFGKYRMVRNPRAVLSKDLVCVKPVNTVNDWQFYRRAIGQCGACLAGDVPIFNEYYQCLMRGTTQKDSTNRKGVVRESEPETGMQYLAIGMPERYRVPDDDTRYSFFLAFDITPDVQIALEREYRSIEPVWRGVNIVSEFGSLTTLM